MHAVLLSNTDNKHHFHCVLYVLLALRDNSKRALGRLRKTAQRAKLAGYAASTFFVRFGACRGVEHDTNKLNLLAQNSIFLPHVAIHTVTTCTVAETRYEEEKLS